MGVVSQQEKSAFFELIDQGLNPTDAARAIGLSPRTGRHLAAKRRVQALASPAPAPTPTPAAPLRSPLPPPPPGKPGSVEWKMARFQDGPLPPVSSHSRYVIASCQNDADIEERFYLALKRFCVVNDARLLILPSYYRPNELSTFFADESDMWFEDCYLRPGLRLATKIRVLPTVVDPLAGKETLSGGDSLIISHPQIAMRSLPTLGDNPPILHATGSINKARPCYQGVGLSAEKAKENHCVGALIVEISKSGAQHFRAIEADEEMGFCDILGRYTADYHCALGRVKALIPGDTHVRVIDQAVKAATYANPDSICATLMPEIICHHDLLDCGSISHHDNHNHWMKAAKAMLKIDSIEDELNEMADFLEETTPPDTQVYVIGSNHNDHLSQWLQSAHSQHETVNAKLYHYLNYLILDSLGQNDSGPLFENPLELWLQRGPRAGLLSFVEFLGRRKSVQILGNEVSLHGDKGANGSRGSPAAFSRMIYRIIHGHGHSGVWRGKTISTGTSSRKDLGYAQSLSSWTHTHVVIHQNGKAQQIHIINGEWRA